MILFRNVLIAAYTGVVEKKSLIHLTNKSRMQLNLILEDIFNGRHI